MFYRLAKSAGHFRRASSLYESEFSRHVDKISHDKVSNRPVRRCSINVVRFDTLLMG